MKEETTYYEIQGCFKHDDRPNSEIFFGSTSKINAFIALKKLEKLKEYQDEGNEKAFDKLYEEINETGEYYFMGNADEYVDTIEVIFDLSGVFETNKIIPSPDEEEEIQKLMTAEAL